MGLFKKYTPPPSSSGRYGKKSAVPETIDTKTWDRLKDSLPFPAEPGRDTKDTTRRVNFGHQRFRGGDLS